MSFDNYDVNDKNKEAFDKAKEFIANEKSIYLFGNVGVGKTHLLAAAVSECFKNYCPSKIEFFNVTKLLRIERDQYETREEAELRFVEYLGNKSVLFIDDFCAENVTGKTSELLYMILDDAISNNKPRLFISGNKSIKFISDNMSARIASRIVGLCGKDGIIKIDSDDYRLRNKK